MRDRAVNSMDLSAVGSGMRSTQRGPVRRVLLREEAARRIVDDLIAGRIGPGAPLLERELADGLGISRTPVREALAVLEGAGYTDRCERSHVLRATPHSVEHVASHYESLDGVLRLAILQWGLPGPVAVAEMEELQRELTASSPEAWLLRHERAWSLSLCESCRCPALTGAVRTMTDLVCRDEMAYLRHRGRLPLPTYGQKESLLRCLRAGDAEVVARELARTWSDRADAVLGWLRRAELGRPS